MRKFVVFFVSTVMLLSLSLPAYSAENITCWFPPGWKNKADKARVIAQQFIKESGGADIRAFVVDGVVVGAMKRQGKEGEFRSNLHRGGSATIIELTDEEDTTALKATKAMGLGVAGVDMLQSSNGPLVLEVNSSPGLEGIETATSKDIAREIIRYVERNV